MSTIGIFLDRNLIVFALSIRSSEKENITSLNCLHLDGSWTRETLLGLVFHRDRHHSVQILPEPLIKINKGTNLYIESYLSFHVMSDGFAKFVLPASLSNFSSLWAFPLLWCIRHDFDQILWMLNQLLLLFQRMTPF